MLISQKDVNTVDKLCINTDDIDYIRVYNDISFLFKGWEQLIQETNAKVNSKVEEILYKLNTISMYLNDHNDKLSERFSMFKNLRIDDLIFKILETIDSSCIDNNQKNSIIDKCYDLLVVISYLNPTEEEFSPFSEAIVRYFQCYSGYLPHRILSVFTNLTITSRNLGFMIYDNLFNKIYKSFKAVSNQFHFEYFYKYFHCILYYNSCQTESVFYHCITEERVQLISYYCLYNFSNLSEQEPRVITIQIFSLVIKTRNMLNFLIDNKFLDFCSDYIDFIYECKNIHSLNPFFNVLGALYIFNGDFELFRENKLYELIKVLLIEKIYVEEMFIFMSNVIVKYSYMLRKSDIFQISFNLLYQSNYRDKIFIISFLYTAFEFFTKEEKLIFFTPNFVNETLIILSGTSHVNDNLPILDELERLVETDDDTGKEIKNILISQNFLECLKQMCDASDDYQRYLDVFISDSNYYSE